MEYVLYIAVAASLAYAGYRFYVSRPERGSDTISGGSGGSSPSETPSSLSFSE